MPKPTRPHPAPPPRLDPAAIGAIVARIPEGFVAIETLAQRLSLRVGTLRTYLEQPEAQVRVSPQGDLVFDPARLTLRDGKPQYLADTARFIHYIRSTCSRYMALKPLLRLVEAIEGIEVPTAFVFGKF